MFRDLVDTGHRRDWILFTVGVISVVVLIILGIFIGLLINYGRIIDTEVVARARSHFNNILITRRWSAQHGGVFVQKTEGMESNPYLENPDIVSTDGTVYTKKNPALMTREISEIAERDGIFKFRITSLYPINPDNAPDEFERNALNSFLEGETEVAMQETSDGETYFQYMAPLKTEATCLQCHGFQGYKEGDIRGGISVRFPISDVKDSIRKNNAFLIILFVALALISAGVLYIFISKLSIRLTTALRRIKEMAIRDGLTGLYNRRYVMDWLERELYRCIRYQTPLTVLILDLDHFKAVNDTYGHQAGDEVLRSLSEMLMVNSRKADIVSRYGGEEFLMVLTNTAGSEALQTAQKIIELFRETTISIDGNREIQVTASIGLASLEPEANAESVSVNEIIKRADEKLYAAKSAGRNRVAW